ncbi:hypothetical protein HJG60_009589 [Phyllostomus discolor]|uniref:Uncharacterized protein n=1 Tax=Phyllostomus discolor TaxID=89673 RepID=A0A834D6C7_9CHIR|nr:hypothetical protein HJG60_009589 [Phyllostomus discolor]
MNNIHRCCTCIPTPSIYRYQSHIYASILTVGLALVIFSVLAFMFISVIVCTFFLVCVFLSDSGITAVFISKDECGGFVVSLLLKEVVWGFCSRCVESRSPVSSPGLSSFTSWAGGRVFWVLSLFPLHQLFYRSRSLLVFVT